MASTSTIRFFTAEHHFPFYLLPTLEIFIKPLRELTNFCIDAALLSDSGYSSKPFHRKRLDTAWCENPPLFGEAAPHFSKILSNSNRQG